MPRREFRKTYNSPHFSFPDKVSQSTTDTLTHQKEKEYKVKYNPESFCKPTRPQYRDNPASTQTSATSFNGPKASKFSRPRYNPPMPRRSGKFGFNKVFGKFAKCGKEFFSDCQEDCACLEAIFGKGDAEMKAD